MKWMMGGLENEIKAASKLQKPTTQEVRRSVMRRAARSNEKILLTHRNGVRRPHSTI